MKRSLWIRIGIGILVCIVLVACTLFYLAREPIPKHITYGMSFSSFYAKELGLNVREVYDAYLNDLGVRHLRLPAYWPLVEPAKDTYDFSDLDYQVSRAEDVHADIIMAVGRRLPRWPECHIPDWAKGLSWNEQKQEIKSYITKVVERYRSSPAITYWQVENEPYLGAFATEQCGPLDESFLKEEVALVHKLDPTRPVLLTDSGNLGNWVGAYSNGDAFGTSVYVYFWNPQLGKFKTVLPPWFYRVKTNLMRLLYGTKPVFLIELSAEPWLLEPVTDAPLSEQYSRMNLTTFNEILTYAKETRFSTQYLWGGEWWYWLKLKGNSDMWDRGKQLFTGTGQ